MKDTNTTYSAGTKALLDDGTNTSNRVWPASVIADYVTGLGYITSSGNAANVTGTVAIANGGTGATTRLNALKALTNENVGSAATYFLTITNSWGKGGYTSVADAKTVLAMTGATDSAAGTAGVVPAPAKGKQTSFLRGDGTWVVPTDTNTTYSAGSGLSLSGTTFSLALTKALVTTALGYTPPTTNTTYSAFTGATVSDAGAAGLVPAPPKRAAYGGGRLLFDDGTWDTPFISYEQYTTNAAHWQTFGYCPTAGATNTHFNGILYGLGSYSSSVQGVYLIEFYKYSATVCSLTVTCLQ